jgi:Zn-dependent protease
MLHNDKPIFRFNGLMGVPVEIGQSILMLIGIFVFAFGSGGNFVYGGILFAMLVISIYLHELGHAWGSQVQGIPVARIMLTGGGGFCQAKRTGSVREQELVVAMGPLVNLALWALASLASTYIIAAQARGLSPDVPFSYGWELQLAFYLSLFARINLAFAIFNLIPVQPLDGGKLFHLAMLRLMIPRKALRITGAVGLIFSVLWIPVLILLYISAGWVLFFIPSIKQHWAMWRS